MKTLTLRDISWSAENGSLGRQVAASEQLTALLPQAEVAELLTKMTASRETLTAAKKIRPAEVDLFGKLDPLFEKGEAVDPVALIAETAEAQTQRDHVTRTVSALEWITMQYQSQLERLVNQSVDGLFDQLDTQLQDLLDEAEATFRALDGVTTADEAFARGKVSEWPAWIAQHARYQEIRRSHLVALQATDPGTGNFRADGRAVGFAYFAALDDALPRYVAGAAVGKHANPSPTYVGFTVTGLPWDPNNPGDLAHWTATVGQRGRLIPVVDPADEALARVSAAHERMSAEAGGRPAPVGRMATDWSSPLDGIAGIDFRAKPDPRR